MSNAGAVPFVIHVAFGKVGDIAVSFYLFIDVQHLLLAVSTFYLVSCYWAHTFLFIENVTFLRL